MKGVILETRLVPRAAIANALTVTKAGLVLDARQGKVLDEKIAAMAAQMLAVTIPSGQWSGSGSDYYFSVTASNVTANSILIPSFDKASGALLKGPVWCVPAAGSFTVHTKAIPAGTVTILVQFIGTMGTANYQVLADVYSKSQVDSIVSQSTANLPTIASVTCTIPNTTAQTTFDLPSGFNNAVLLGARCVTKYSSLVDSSYSDGEYFGNVTLAGNGKFHYTPKVAGNSTQVLFVFMKTN